MSFDPRTISQPAYEALNKLRKAEETKEQKAIESLNTQDLEENQKKTQKEKIKAKTKERLKEQKNQALELYTYLSTWGMLRLKAEERAISDDKEGKKKVVESFFECLQKTASRNENDLVGTSGLETLSKLEIDDYLGLTGLGLALAQEFSFWANAIYYDIKGEA